MNSSDTAFDVFFSYHWRDREPVEAVARDLRKRGLVVFLDRWYLAPGRPWPQALEKALATCGSIAVFIGPHGMGSWQQRESYVALDRQAREPEFSVIPVLLPGADPPLGFLSLNTWVDLRGGVDDPDAWSILAAAVRGEPPGPELQGRIKATKSDICPYRGLRFFREEDAPFFFGRDFFVERLVEKVDRSSLLAVVGASGSGKSSVVRAGLVPLLRRRVRRKTWDVATMVPTDRPLYAMAGAILPLLKPEMEEIDRLSSVGTLAKHLAQGSIALRDVVTRILEKQRGTDRLLLVVDQWEELYTLCNDDHIRDLFLDQLLEATEKTPLSVVFTLRGDFYGRALSYRPLVDRLQDATVNLGPMTREELEQAVEGPAQKVWLRFEPELVNRILDDVGDEPGRLPLLEFALTELWARRKDSWLSFAAYDDIGRVTGAIAERAEEEHEGLTPKQRELAQRIFTRLVRVARPEEGGEDTRLRATFDQLCEDEQEVVRRLADARLLVTGRDETTGQETVEVTHEALIRSWKRLREWLDKDREFLLWRQRLVAALDEWKRSNHDEGALLRGAPLAEAERWLGERSDGLNDEERSFIEKCVDLRDREREVQRRRRRWFTLLTLGAATIFLVLALLAWHQRREAREQSRIAFSRQLAAQSSSHVDDQLDLALLLGVEACRAFNTVEARSSLLTPLVSRPYISNFLHGHTAAVWSVAFSPDGNTLASASSDNTIRLWDVNVESWQARACKIANRNLTRDEWQFYMGDRPYRPTCPECPVPEE